MFRLILNGLIALALTGLSIAPVQGSRIMKPDQTTFMKGVEPSVPVASGPVVVTYRAVAYFDTAYGSGPATLSGVTVAATGKVLVYVINYGNGAQTVTGLTANSGALTFTLIGSGGTSSTRVYAFYLDNPGTTSLDLSATLSGSSRVTSFTVVTMTGAASGGPVSSDFREIVLTNEDPIDVDAGLAAPTDGALVTVVDTDSSAALTFTGSTEVGETTFGGGTERLAVAVQTTAANVTILGQPSGGPGYSGIRVGNTTWAP